MKILLVGSYKRRLEEGKSVLEERVALGRLKRVDCALTFDDAIGCLGQHKYDGVISTILFPKSKTTYEKEQTGKLIAQYALDNGIPVVLNSRQDSPVRGWAINKGINLSYNAISDNWNADFLNLAYHHEAKKYGWMSIDSDGFKVGTDNGHFSVGNPHLRQYFADMNTMKNELRDDLKSILEVDLAFLLKHDVVRFKFEPNYPYPSFTFLGDVFRKYGKGLYYENKDEK